MRLGIVNYVKFFLTLFIVTFIVSFRASSGGFQGGTMPHRSDRQLAYDYVNGDIRAFRVIVQRHRQRMLFVARSYARDEHDAQDIVQEALLRASRSMHTYRGDAKLTTWLHRTVTNVAYDYYRRTETRNGNIVSYDDHDVVNQEHHRFLSHDPTTTVEQFLALRQAVANLPSAQRKALLLVDVYGMSVENAADTLGIRPGTVKSRRHRAREAVAAAVSVE